MCFGCSNATGSGIVERGGIERERERETALKVFPMGTERGPTCRVVYQCLFSAPRRTSVTTSAFSPTAGFRLNRSNSQYELGNMGSVKMLNCTRFQSNTIK